jgi:hypothetical protein
VEATVGTRRATAGTVILSAIIGTALGAVIGAMVARRRAEGRTTKIDARAAATAGITTFTLAKQIVDMFSA